MKQGNGVSQRNWKALPSPGTLTSTSILFSSAGATRLPKEIRRAGACAKLVARTRRRVRGGNSVGGVGGGPLLTEHGDRGDVGTIVARNCRWGSIGPKMLGLRWRLALSFGMPDGRWEDLEVTVVADVLEPALEYSVALLLLLDDVTLLLDFEPVLIRISAHSLGLTVARGLTVVGDEGGKTGLRETVAGFVRSFFARLVRSFSSSSEESEGEVEPLSRYAPPNDGARFNAWGICVTPRGAQNESERRIRWIRGSSAVSTK